MVVINLPNSNPDFIIDTRTEYPYGGTIGAYLDALVSTLIHMLSRLGSKLV